MTALLGPVLVAAFWFAAGWFWRDVRERHNRRNRRGGYVRRVPMSSLHPREPKP